MKRLLKGIKRFLWVLIVGSMIAFHSVYQKEFKSIEEITVEIEEDEKE